MNINKDLLKKLILAVAVAVLVWLVIWFIFFAAIVKIDVKESSVLADSKHSLQAKNTQNDNLRIVNIGGYAIIPRSTTQLIAKADEYSAETIRATSNLGLWNSEEIVINLAAQKKLTNVTVNSLGCRLFTNTQSYDYNCGLNEGLFTFDTSGTNWQNVKKHSSFGQIYQFKDGYLKFAAPTQAGDAEPNKINYYNLVQNSVIDIDIPSEIPSLIEANIITDKTNSNSQNIWLMDETSGFFYYTSNLGKSYSKVALPEDLNIRFDAFICDAVDTKIYCYYGNKDDTDSAEETAYFEENEKYKLLEIDFASNNSIVYDLPEIAVEQLVVDSESNVYFVSEYTLYTSNLSNGVSVYPVLNDVSFVSSGSKVSFIYDGAIYKFADKRNISKFFESNNINVTTTSSYGQNLYISGLSGINQQIAYGYILSEEEDTTLPGNRAEDVFPVQSEGLELIRRMDYSDGKIRVDLSLDMVTNKSTGEYFYVSQAQYDEAIAKANEILTSSGLDLTEFDIVYTY